MYADLSEVRLHYVSAGSGPPLLFLHGFPDTHRIWRRQLEALAGQFTVIAPDLRGYGESSRPYPVEAYRADKLARDVSELIQHLGHRQAGVVGHDWGGAIGWLLASLYPERVSRLAILNCPHPAAFQQRLLRNPRQLLRSWYMFFFQLPWLPEKLIGRRLKGWLRAMHSAAVHPQRYTPEDLEENVRALSPPGALKAALNYYRAALRPSAPTGGPIGVETMIVWGKQDPALGEDTALASLAYLRKRAHLHMLPEAGHWVQLDAADEVNQLLGSFFARV